MAATKKKTKEKEKIHVCFWCGLPKDMSYDEFPKGQQAIVSDYDMCDRCVDETGEGIRVIGVTNEPIVDGMFPILKDDSDGTLLYPTGSTMVVSEDYLKEVLFDGLNDKKDIPKEQFEREKKMMDYIIENKKMLMPEEILTDIIEKVRELQGEELTD